MPGRPSGSAPATDGDSGTTLTYSITGGSGASLFAIDSNGQITVATGTVLNYEAATTYSLTIEASDGSLTDNASVTIGVDDVNESPVFSPASYQFSLAENSSAGQSVGSVSAIDPDAQTTLAYTITGGSGEALFAVDSSGQITVASGATLDYETTASYSLNVRASDGTFTADATVTIDLTDVYENAPPVFSPASYNLSITEESTAGTSVGTVSASDPEGATLTYAIVSGNADANFAIDSQSGQITVASGAVLDYETTSSYSLTVRASDGTYAADATVAITVSDIVENRSPVFDPASYSFVVDETAAGGDEVGEVAASDPDGNTLSYTITAGDPDSLFSIDAEGRITLASGAELDDDETPSFTLTVQVSDGSLVDEATVEIIVDGEPQNPPSVAADDWYDVGYFPALGLSVLTLADPGVFANDSDPDGDPMTIVPLMYPQHGTLEWGLDGGFTYTADVGFSGSDWFCYRIFDGALYGNTASVFLTITGDAAPVFSPASYSLSVAENSPAGTAVGTASATDADGDPIAYSILEGNEAGYFAISGASAAITVAEGANLDYETTISYSLTIQADDDILTSTATVEIAITNVVENTPPVFDPASYSFSVGENSPAETAIGTVQATDPQGEVLVFSIVSGNSAGYFAINSSTGAITVAGGAQLDYETDASYTLGVQASDGVFTATASVQVTIGDVYENHAPSAAGDAYGLEEDGVLTVIAASGVLDNDEDLDGDLLAASLVSLPVHGTVILEDDGSLIYTPNPNFRGTDHFTYQASDGIDSSSVATVTITVSPVNDAPQAVDDSVSVNEDGSLTIAGPGVLNNDIDVDGDVLTVALVADAEHGTLTLNADGGFSYTPDADYSGPDSFTYQAQRWSRFVQRGDRHDHGQSGQRCAGGV